MPFLCEPYSSRDIGYYGLPWFYETTSRFVVKTFTYV